MTLRLILTRHAKSDWGNPIHSDRERPLNARGRASAPLIGNWIKTNRYIPNEVLCSDAVRTRETLACLGYDHAPEIRFEPALYLGDPADLGAALATAKGKSVQIIAHNPGIAEFCAHIVVREPEHPDFFRYPTCATTVIEFEATAWNEINTGTCVAFTLPRDLG